MHIVECGECPFVCFMRIFLMLNPSHVKHVCIYVFPRSLNKYSKYLSMLVKWIHQVLYKHEAQIMVRLWKGLIYSKFNWMERLTHQTTIVHTVHLLPTVEAFGTLSNIPRPSKLDKCLLYDANTPPKTQGSMEKRWRCSSPYGRLISKNYYRHA